MVVHCFPIGQLRANCFLVTGERTNQAVIIDPGDEGNFLSEKILELKIKPVAMILTHAHFDHLMAAEEIRLNFKIPLFVHEKDVFLLKKANQSADYWLGVKEKSLLPQKWQLIKDSQMIEFGRENLRVIHTPGHTPGSICLYNQEKGILFSGDLLFKNSVGRTDFSYGSAERLQKSLKKIFSLPPKTLVYPGHGESFILNTWYH